VCSNGGVRRETWPALLILLAPSLASASVEVTRDGPRVSVRAEAAPLSDVLDRLARELGMKVVYEGAAPRNLVNASLASRTPAEAVLSVLEGLGLDYLARMDATGARIEQLVIVRPSPTGATSLIDASPARPRPVVQDAEEDEDEEEDVPLGKPGGQARPPTPNPRPRAQDPQSPAASGTLPAPAASAPMNYSVSPFAPAPPQRPVLNPPAPAAPADGSGDEEPEER